MKTSTYILVLRSTYRRTACNSSREMTCGGTPEVKTRDPIASKLGSPFHSSPMYAVCAAVLGGVWFQQRHVSHVYLINRPLPSHPPPRSALHSILRNFTIHAEPVPPAMAHGVASRGGTPNGLAPLCVKDKRKAQAAAAAAAAAVAAAAAAAVAVAATANARGNDNNSSAANDVGSNSAPCCASEALSPPSPRRPAPVVIEHSEIIRLASQYTPCAGCSAAVKGLLQRPIEELRLVNAVVEEGVREGGGEAGGVGKGGGGGRNKGGGGGRNGSDGGGGGAHGERAGGHGCEHSASEGGHSCGQSSSSSTAGLPRSLYLREAYLTDRARFDQVGDDTLE